MINQNNATIKITLSKKQVAWLTETSIKLGISKSKLIKYLIDKNIKRMNESFTPEQMEWMIKIAKTKWLD